MLQNYRIEVIGTDFSDLDVNQSFNVISGAKGTFADNILIKDSNVETVSGAILKLDTENEDYGIYNAEYVYSFTRRSSDKYIRKYIQKQCAFSDYPYSQRAEDKNI